MPAARSELHLPALDLADTPSGRYTLAFGGATTFVDDSCLDYPLEAQCAVLVVERPISDLNWDGVVNEQDLFLLMDAIARGDTRFDLDDDGDVDAADLDVLVTELGVRGTWTLAPATPFGDGPPRAGCPEQPALSFAGTFNNTSKFFRTTQPATATQSQQYAQRIGANVASITGAAENSFVAGISPSSMWIGLSVNHQGGGCNYGNYTLAWDTGESTAYRSWGTTCEPNNQGGIESRVAINEHRSGGWNDLNPANMYVSVIELRLGQMRIITPVNSASPRSRYVFLTGTAPAGDTIALAVHDKELNLLRTVTTNADSDGRWEKVVLAGECAGMVVARSSSEPNRADAIVLNIAAGSPNVPLVDYELLRTADIVLSTGTSGLQREVYGANYSHASLFVGADADGTPMVTEAIMSPGLRWPNITGQVVTVPLEESEAYRDRTVADIYRPRAERTWQVRQNIAAAGRGYTGRPYWVPRALVTLPLLARAMWDSDRHRPLPGLESYFASVTSEMGNWTLRNDTFICSTLVWRVYYDEATLDLAWLVQERFGGIYGGWDPALQEEFRRVWVFPDTLRTNTLLRRVN